MERPETLPDRTELLAEPEAHKRRAIAARKERRLWDALYEDALYFHEMRLVEVRLYKHSVQELDYSCSLGVCDQEYYDKQLAWEKEFLESWSNERRCMGTMGYTMKRLKIPEEEQQRIVAEVVKWSHSLGSDDALKDILYRTRK